MEKFILTSIIVFAFAVSSVSYAGFQFAGSVESCKLEPNRVEFRLSNSLLNIYIIDENIIRFRYSQGEFSGAPSYAVIYEMPAESKFSFKEEKDEYLITTAELNVKVKKNPCRISIYDKEMNLINSDDDSFGVSFDDGEVRCFKKLLPGERFYGLGEKSDELMKNGNQYTMWNTDYPAYTSRKDPLYVSIPFFIGIRNYNSYGIFFDNSYKSYFNMGASNDRFYWFGADKGEMDYYFIYGPESKRVISDYTKLTGRAELPPMWALGYQQSRWSYYPESKVMSIANTFRERDIPCDVIYLDIHYMDGYRVFTWDEQRFPDPAKMLSELKRLGFKVIPIIDPGVKADSNYFAAKEGLSKNLFAKYPDGTEYQGEVWPSWAYFPDFTKNDTRLWWGEKLSVLLKQGVAGFWNDMNEPAVWGQNFPDIVQFDDNGFKSDHKKIHNVYGLSMAKATREGLLKHSPDERHFILTRAAFAGIQRYAAVWTGDNEATEEHLRLSCTMPQGMGLSGVAFTGPDAGGFIGEPSEALYSRWMELASFLPFFRGHSEINSRAKEPFSFSESTESIAREAIKNRYRMLPFWYNEFYNSSQSGLPVLRPMILNFQNDENCYSADAQYQFMLGENLLVAPVLSSTENFKKLYLPAGNWYCIGENKIYGGGKWIILEVPLGRIPVFLKEGGFIPMQESQNYVGEKNLEQLEILLFPSGSSKYSFYEDDGKSYDYKKGKFSITEFEEKSDDKHLRISAKKTKDGYSGSHKYYLFKIPSMDKPESASLNGKMLASKTENTQNTYYFYDNSKSVLLIRVDSVNDINIEVKFN